jgi:hypothetical protein
MIGYEDLTWTGNELRLGRRIVATPRARRRLAQAVPRQTAERSPNRYGQPDPRQGRCAVSRPWHFKHPREARGGTQDSSFRAGR